MFEVPEFTEEDLLTIYKDLLAFPDAHGDVSVGVQGVLSHEEDLSAIHAVDQRLSQADTDSVTLFQQPYRRILSRVQAIVARTETFLPLAASVDAPTTQATSTASRTKFPVTLLSNSEWAALTRICVCCSVSPLFLCILLTRCFRFKCRTQMQQNRH